VYHGGLHPHPKKPDISTPLAIRHSHIHLTGLSFDIPRGDGVGHTGGNSPC